MEDSGPGSQSLAHPDPWSSRVIPELRGQRILLRRLKPSDIDDRRALGRSAEENRLYGGDLRSDEPMTREHAETWYAAGSDNADHTRWAIEFESRCIGSCGLTGTRGVVRYAIGISDPSVWGQGLGTEVARLVLEYAFDQPQIERVELMVLAYNQRAIASYKKAGFRLREILKDNAEVGGEKFDDWMMDIDRATHQAR